MTDDMSFLTDCWHTSRSLAAGNEWSSSDRLIMSLTVRWFLQRWQVWEREINKSSCSVAGGGESALLQPNVWKCASDAWAVLGIFLLSQRKTISLMNWGLTGHASVGSVGGFGAKTMSTHQCLLFVCQLYNEHYASGAVYIPSGGQRSALQTAERPLMTLMHFNAYFDLIEVTYRGFITWNCSFSHFST